jgi:hypothetical protein
LLFISSQYQLFRHTLFLLESYELIKGLVSQLTQKRRAITSQKRTCTHQNRYSDRITRLHRSRTSRIIMAPVSTLNHLREVYGISEFEEKHVSSQYSRNSGSRTRFYNRAIKNFNDAYQDVESNKGLPYERLSETCCCKHSCSSLQHADVLQEHKDI